MPSLRRKSPAFGRRKLPAEFFVAMEIVPGHKARFLLVQSVIPSECQVKDDKVVLNFSDEKERTSPNRQMIIGKDAEGLHFIRSGLLEGMPEELEKVRLLRTKKSFRGILDDHGGEYHDLDEKELPKTLPGEYIDLLARLWQYSFESLATLASHPNAKPETLSWTYSLLPAKDKWWKEHENLALAIAGNPNTPVSILEDAWKRWEEPKYWRVVACNP